MDGQQKPEDVKTENGAGGAPVDQSNQQQVPQQQYGQPQMYQGMPSMDMNDPNVAAMIQQQIMMANANAAGGMGVQGGFYDPNQQFGGYPYGAATGYPFMNMYGGGAPMMMQQHQYGAPQQPQYQTVAGSQSGGYPVRGGYQRGGHSGGYRGGYQNNLGGGHSSGGTGSKFNTQKFKTQICRHFQQQGSCTQGDACLFAHGQHELRNMNDPVPADADAKAAIVQQNNQGLQHHNSHGGYTQGGGRGGYSRGGYQGGNVSHSRGGYSQGGSSHHRGGYQGGSSSSGGYQQRPYNNNSMGNTSSGGSQNFKTAKCKNFDMGNCKYGASCTFAHGDQDLRKTVSGGSTSPGGGSPVYTQVHQQHQYVTPHQVPSNQSNMGSQPILLSETNFPVLGAQPNAQ